jgi:predicted RNase H-like HicB family nuclease
MYGVWYWTMIDRESDGRFIASIPDLEDVAAWGPTEREALAQVADLATEHVRATVKAGERVPHPRQFSELPSPIRSKELGRAIIPVEMPRTRLAKSRPITWRCEDRNAAALYVAQ